MSPRGLIYYKLYEISLTISTFTIIDKMIYKEQVMLRSTETGDMKQLSFKDKESFELLFRQYYQMLCSYAYRFVNDADTAEEIVQDLFYKIWEKRSEIQINTSEKSYLYSAVHNRCLKFIEHRNVESRYKSYYLMHGSEIDNAPPQNSNVRELQIIIDQTLDTLPERCGRIFRLNRFEGLKYQEIADKLAISIKTVEANMGKALKILRKNLKDYVEIA
jgi:RNA polymerase sigma-70 factor, ECF subfamily